MSRSVMSSHSGGASRYSRRSAPNYHEFDEADDLYSAMSGPMSSTQSMFTSMPSHLSAASRTTAVRSSAMHPSSARSAALVAGGGGGQANADAEQNRKRRRSALALASSFAFMALLAFSGVLGGDDDSGGGLFSSSMLSRSLRYSSFKPFVPPQGVGSNSTFLLGIFSTRSQKDFERRQLIRDTYLTHGRDPRICYLSLYMQLEEEDRARCNVVYTFVVGGRDEGPTEHQDDTVKMTLNRAKIDGNAEDDVTYLNIRENMEDGKSDTWFKYGAYLSSRLGYSFDYVGKADSDAYINVDSLIEFVATELPSAPNNVHIYGGIPWANFRKSGLYMAGQFYFMSADLAHYVGYNLTPQDRASMREDRHTEDMDMGNFIFSSPHPIKFVICSNHMFWHHPVKKQEEWDEFAKSYGMGGRPAWRNKVMPWKALAQIWLKKGLIRAPSDEPQRQSGEPPRRPKSQQPPQPQPDEPKAIAPEQQPDEPKAIAPEQQPSEPFAPSEQRQPAVQTK